MDAPLEWLAQMEQFVAEAKLYTDAELGFHCDESLRPLVSSDKWHEVIQAILVQLARQGDRIEAKLGMVESLEKAKGPDVNAPASAIPPPTA